MDPDIEPWALQPSETVCGTCHLAHNRHLRECPTCKES